MTPVILIDPFLFGLGNYFLSDLYLSNLKSSFEMMLILTFVNTLLLTLIEKTQF